MTCQRLREKLSEVAKTSALRAIQGDEYPDLLRVCRGYGRCIEPRKKDGSSESTCPFCALAYDLRTQQQVDDFVSLMFVGH